MMCCCRAFLSQVVFFKSKLQIAYIICSGNHFMSSLLLISLSYLTNHARMIITTNYSFGGIGHGLQLLVHEQRDNYAFRGPQGSPKLPRYHHRGRVRYDTSTRGNDKLYVTAYTSSTPIVKTAAPPKLYSTS